MILCSEPTALPILFNTHHPYGRYDIFRCYASFRVYPMRLNLADFCTKKWRLSSSKISTLWNVFTTHCRRQYSIGRDRIPAMPFSPPEKGLFGSLIAGGFTTSGPLISDFIRSSSTFTIFSCTSYRPIQNVPSINSNGLV